MSTVTTNYGFTKPAGVEQYSLATHNNNLDGIDAAIKNVDNKLQKVQTGTATVAVANATAAGSLAVTFATPFAAAPVVTLTKAQTSGSASSLRKLQPVVTGITATGFVANLETADGANVGAAFNVPCTWIAVLV